MMEYVLSGLRTEMVSLQDQLGFMDLDKKNIPPHVWNIIEAGFELFTELEEKLEKVNILATEAQEVAGCLLDAEEEKDSLNEKKPSLDGDTYPSGLAGIKMINEKNP